MRRLLHDLGDPQHAWHSVHVGGTKGKGSTAAMVSRAATAAGYRAGCYASPHVRTLRERITLDGVPISGPALDALVADLRPTLEAAQERERGALSHFEVLTALAYAHFAREHAEVGVIEVGLGGVRDATNVLPADALAAAVITAIGDDHADALGGDVAAVAAAKAGIMQHGRPVVLAAQPSAQAAEVLRKHGEDRFLGVVCGGREGRGREERETPLRPLRRCSVALHRPRHPVPCRLVLVTGSSCPISKPASRTAAAESLHATVIDALSAAPITDSVLEWFQDDGAGRSRLRTRAHLTLNEPVAGWLGAVPGAQYGARDWQGCCVGGERRRMGRGYGGCDRPYLGMGRGARDGGEGGQGLQHAHCSTLNAFSARAVVRPGSEGPDSRCTPSLKRATQALPTLCAPAIQRLSSASWVHTSWPMRRRRCVPPRASHSLVVST